ncbi:unnamed protein product [Vitrella brassicaformis CCMP3155]|uniref:Uncharacterized protein n=1 Tax=Vitrella brassicaformis (strain CCMP3155) TaxID=1169540 RepID=A0A0G4F460_VITBC|nr:unnamed protein product [Vitrella brassicaformis CCMP3155]|eukprot:CEM06511.1 unnamed protein product [Vitrella brassicaformis CCMP3155]
MAGEDSGAGYQGVRAYLTSRHIPVISARSHAEATGRGDLHPGKWKRGCFATLFQALRQKGVCKVKMLEGPSERQLMMEHEELGHHLDTLAKEPWENFTMSDQTRFWPRDSDYLEKRPIPHCSPTANAADVLRRVSLWSSPSLAKDAAVSRTLPAPHTRPTGNSPPPVATLKHTHDQDDLTGRKRPLSGASVRRDTAKQPPVKKSRTALLTLEAMQGLRSYLLHWQGQIFGYRRLSFPKRRLNARARRVGRARRAA